MAKTVTKAIFSPPLDMWEKIDLLRALIPAIYIKHETHINNYNTKAIT
jgi:hypothetical protein